MKVETYKATLKHDNGKVEITIVSISGEQGAKKMIMSAEGCPECSIIKITKI